MGPLPASPRQRVQAGKSCSKQEDKQREEGRDSEPQAPLLTSSVTLAIHLSFLSLGFLICELRKVHDIITNIFPVLKFQDAIRF